MTVTMPGTCAHRWELPDNPASVSMIRAVIRQTLRSWGLDKIADDIELMAGELVANAVTHGRGPVTVEVATRDGWPGGPELVCEVSDSSPRLPEPGRPDLLDEAGRGLMIVSAVAATAGARRTSTGKTVWFRVRLPEGSVR